MADTAESELSDVRYLRNINLFADLTDRDLELVSQACRTRRYASGEYLYFQEDPATHIHVLLEGRVKLTQVTPEGQQVILRYAGPGEVFGVVAVLSNTAFPTSAQAVEESRVAMWEKSGMYDLIMNEKTGLDVWQVPPAQCHPLIFSTFESLAPGEAFVLLNDHDPKPLYYQFSFERSGQFTCDYLEQGPLDWRVRVGKV